MRFDVFQFDETHELYAHMNINYVRLDQLPSFDQWGDVLEPLVNGDFFTTTGEVLLPEVELSTSADDRIDARVRVDWTFPLRFAEIVWGDGTTTHRTIIPLAETRQFGAKTFDWTTEAPDWQWARVAVWDVAGKRGVRQSCVAGLIPALTHAPSLRDGFSVERPDGGAGPPFPEKPSNRSPPRFLRGASATSSGVCRPLFVTFRSAP